MLLTGAHEIWPSQWCRLVFLVSSRRVSLVLDLHIFHVCLCDVPLYCILSVGEKARTSTLSTAIATLSVSPRKGWLENIFFRTGMFFFVVESGQSVQLDLFQHNVDSDLTQLCSCERSKEYLTK